MTAEDPAAALSTSESTSAARREHPPSTRRICSLVAIVIIVGLYSYPTLRTLATTRYTGLPPAFAPDLGLYLSLSRLESNSQGAVIDPYYHQSVPAKSLGFLKFRLAPQCFGLLTSLLGGRTWLAMFVWNVFWWGALCVLALWLSRNLFRRAPPEQELVGLFVLMLLPITALPGLITAFTRFSFLSAFDGVQFPYIRPFFPQMAVALLLAYVGLQIIALRKRSAWAWALMVGVQFAALASFPYATMMMAGTTAIAGGWYLWAHRGKGAWLPIAGYTVACAIVDLVFLLHDASEFRSGLPGQESLFHLRLALVPLMIGKMWLLLAVLTLATVFSRTVRSEARWTLVGLGLTNMALLLGDAVVPETTIMLSDHAGYFTHAVIVVLLIHAISVCRERLPGTQSVSRFASVIVVGGCIVIGVFVAESTYRRSLPANTEQADMGAWLGRGEVAINDLVISEFDACAWVPLLSRAEVLFCRTAQCLLTPEHNDLVHRPREAWYLYFEGRDRRWVQNSRELARYGFYFEQFVKEDSERRSVGPRKEILALLDHLETEQERSGEFFRPYRRIWIVQRANKPIFVEERLAAYLEFQTREQIGTLMVWSANLHSPIPAK